MLEKNLYEIVGFPDGIVWELDAASLVTPHCKIHKMQLLEFPTAIIIEGHLVAGDSLECPTDGQKFTLKYDIPNAKKHVQSALRANELKDYKIVRIDPEGYDVVAKEHVNLKSDFWIETKLSETAKGLQLMIQAGKKSEDGKKSQLFVDLPAQRLGFDVSSKDRHPSGLFTTVNATFRNSSTTIDSR